MQKFFRSFFSLCLLFLVTSIANAQREGEFFTHIYNFKGDPQEVIYNYYIPKINSNERLPLLVCHDGLAIINDEYENTSPQGCLRSEWKAWADLNHIAILGIGFRFNWEQWERNESYQYAQVWSGKALLEIIDKLSVDQPIDPNRLMMFGISAGAQFSIRFAFMNPDRVIAVAANAAGGYDEPKEFIPTKLLITVGELDNEDIKRRNMAEYVIERYKELGIDATLYIVPEIAHRQIEEQNQMAREFFDKNLL